MSSDIDLLGTENHSQDSLPARRVRSDLRRGKRCLAGFSVVMAMQCHGFKGPLRSVADLGLGTRLKGLCCRTLRFAWEGPGTGG